MSELRPVELDRIEDLLEGLEQEGVPAELDLEDAEARRVVGERLAEYRAILQVYREAVPMQDVPVGALDDVLEHARRSADSAEAAVQAAPPKPSLWERLRGTFVIPGVALAAAAVLVVVLVRPDDEAPETVAMSESSTREAGPQRAEEHAAAEPASADERLADATLEQARHDEAEARGGGVLDARPAHDEEDRQQEGEAEVSRSAVDDDRGGVIGGAEPLPHEPAPTAAKSSSPRKKSEAPKSARPGSMPPPVPAEPAPGGSAGTKGEAPSGTTGAQLAWRTVEKGDAYRRSGDCKAARASYANVLSTPEAKADARVIARAHAGMGLCDAQAGQPKQAERHFAKARKSDPSVAAFIDSELAKLDAARK